MRHVVVRSSFSGLSIVTWKRSIWHTGIRVIGLDSCLTGFRIKCLSARRSRISRSSKVNLKPIMADESDAFYVVRKGDIVGIYKSLSDCQAQVSSSVCDPSVSVYKGYCLRKETEDYFASQGFKDALYSMHAAHLKDDMFSTLVACPFQVFFISLCAHFEVVTSVSNHREKVVNLMDDNPSYATNRSPALHERIMITDKVLDLQGIAVSSVMPTAPSNKHSKMAPVVEAQPNSELMTCILEFDGASKGNPGMAGAGAVLRAEDGNVVQDLWQTKNQNMADLCREVKKLKDMFQSFSITHEFNAIADNLANLAVTLPGAEHKSAYTFHSFVYRSYSVFLMICSWRIWHDDNRLDRILPSSNGDRQITHSGSMLPPPSPHPCFLVIFGILDSYVAFPSHYACDLATDALRGMR
ncbi:hypothetical protein MA16_Dca003425 [Dendrobium catenatum]|uniref:Ribonuclease H1 N-terminal domain-containing protein n=1 Tax=Dendrobium catenatum TaxID=906689 RepID=A0A2I0XCS5_9ASPA|nr:hypothetical protein MA16_Dca003425 [Dendrobium catenatum]